MTAILFALAVLALVVYGLERNHQRQRPPASRLAGSTNAEDRDVARVRNDLQAAATHASTRTEPTRRRPHPVRRHHALRLNPHR